VGVESLKGGPWREFPRTKQPRSQPHMSIHPSVHPSRISAPQKHNGYSTFCASRRPQGSPHVDPPQGSPQGSSQGSPPRDLPRDLPRNPPPGISRIYPPGNPPRDFERGIFPRDPSQGSPRPSSLEILLFLPPTPEGDRRNRAHVQSYLAVLPHPSSRPRPITFNRIVSYSSMRDHDVMFNFRLVEAVYVA
jgi:hypothetical protein